MKITKLSMGKLSLPFVTSFPQSNATRGTGSSVLVTAHTASGNRGHGEYCPRQYVSGEDVSSVLAFFEQHSDSLRDQIVDLASLTHWIDQHEELIDAVPAAFTAVELALLDVLARDRGQSVEKLLQISRPRKSYRYTAVLGGGSRRLFRQQLQFYRRFGFKSFKIKLCGEISEDLARIEELKSIGICATSVRAGANNLWSDVSLAADYLSVLEYPFWAIEEPLDAGDFQGVSLLAEALDTRIILNESCLNNRHLRKIECLGLPAWSFIPNLRISKQGGLIRALKHCKIARDHGHDLIIGADIGESSLLTRAGMVLGSAAGDALVGHEGGLGTWLLTRDIVDSPLVSGREGVLRGVSLKKAGFGLTPSTI